MAHTPGPFRFSDARGDGTYSVRDSRGHRVCIAYTLDDAKLFTAAHDLVSALQEMVLDACKCQQDQDVNVIIRARAALAKAQGE